MACWINGAPFGALAALVLAAAPLAAAAQPQENKDFEWRDFDLSGEPDPSNPYFATPKMVAKGGIDWSVFGGTGGTTKLAVTGKPMTPEKKPPEPKPALVNADIDWSVFE